MADGQLSHLAKKTGHSRGWAGVSLFIAALVILPAVSLIYLALNPEENIWGHLFRTSLPVYLLNTVVLLFGNALGTVFIGVACAWLVTMCEFPGRKIFSWMLLLPIAVPAYIAAYAYTDVFEYAGPIQSALRSIMGWSNSADYWFPEIRSKGGAIFVMSLVFYPYVYLLARSSFLELSRGSLETAQTLGKNPWQIFFQVAVPIARPGIVIGCALVLMETVNDYGTVSFFAVNTLTAGIYDVWLNMGNLGGAAQISSLTLVLALVLLAAEKQSRQQRRYFQSSDRGNEYRLYKLSDKRALAAQFVCVFTIFLGFGIPVIILSVMAAQNFAESWTPRFLEMAVRSLLLAGGAALLTLIVAVVVVYGRRLSRNRFVHHLNHFAAVGYAMPGAVLAIGVLIPMAGADNAIDGFMREIFGISTGLLMTGSVFALLVAYLVRFLIVAVGSVEASLLKITPSMDMAARTLGYRPFRVLTRFHLPLMRPGLFAGLLLVFVDCIKELPATLILRPFNFETLATNVFQYASDEQIELAALGSVFIVVAGLIPVFLLSREMIRGRRKGQDRILVVGKQAVAAA